MKTKISNQLQTIYQQLSTHFGPCHWWPADTQLEILAGIVLTQNTAWTSVEKALANLKTANLLDPHRLLATPPNQLAETIRPSGYFNVKQKRLRSLVSWFVERFAGSFEKMKRIPLDQLRKELLAVHGVGPESVDSILLYVLDKPSFVIDAYTRRIFARHGICEPHASYDHLQKLFNDHLPRNAKLFNEYHALIVYTGKEFCKPKARCQNCPLRTLKHDATR